MNICLILIIVAVVLLLMSNNNEYFSQDRCEVQSKELEKVTNLFNNSCVNGNLKDRVDQHNNRYDCRNLESKKISLQHQVNSSCDCEIVSNLQVDPSNKFNPNFNIKIE